MAAKAGSSRSNLADLGRVIVLSVGCLAFTIAGIWLVVAAPQGTSSRVWGAVGVLFFGSCLVVILGLAIKGKALPARAADRSPLQQLIVPIVMVFLMQWPLKLWFCVPLIAAWALLWATKGDRRLLVVASTLAALIAIGQGIAFAIGLVDVALEGTARAAIMPMVFLCLVLWLDVRIVLEARRRLVARPSA